MHQLLLTNPMERLIRRIMYTRLYFAENTFHPYSYFLDKMSAPCCAFIHVSYIMNHAFNHMHHTHIYVSLQHHNIIFWHINSNTAFNKLHLSIIVLSQSGFLLIQNYNITDSSQRGRLINNVVQNDIIMFLGYSLVMTLVMIMMTITIHICEWTCRLFWCSTRIYGCSSLYIYIHNKCATQSCLNIYRKRAFAESS